MFIEHLLCFTHCSMNAKATELDTAPPLALGSSQSIAKLAQVPPLSDPGPVADEVP